MNLRAFVKRFLPRTLLGRSLLIIVSPLILLQVVSANQSRLFRLRRWLLLALLVALIPAILSRRIWLALALALPALAIGLAYLPVFLPH